MLLTPREVQNGDRWCVEVKWDGCRARFRYDERAVALHPQRPALDNPLTRFERARTATGARDRVVQKLPPDTRSADECVHAIMDFPRFRGHLS
jgi:hypothetical protein